MSIKFAYIAPDPPPPVSTTSISTTVTPVTITGGPTPRRTLTGDDRHRMCEYHESHPGVKQTAIGGTSPALYPPPILQLTLSSNVWYRQKVCMHLLIEPPISYSTLALFPKILRKICLIWLAYPHSVRNSRAIACCCRRFVRSAGPEEISGKSFWNCNAASMPNFSGFWPFVCSQFWRF